MRVILLLNEFLKLMKLSILIVKIQRDNKYCDLLLQSIKQTISLGRIFAKFFIVHE